MEKLSILLLQVLHIQIEHHVVYIRFHLQSCLISIATLLGVQATPLGELCQFNTPMVLWLGVW